MPLTKKKTTSKYKVDLSAVPEDKRDELLSEVGNYLLTSILDDLGRGYSPVTGSQFKSLDKEYADEEKGDDRTPNLELEGDMLSKLEYRITGNTIEYGIFDEDQAIKSYGHNTGMLGHPWLEGKTPKRQFIPDEDGNLREGIMKGIRSLEREYQREPELGIEVIEQRSALDIFLGNLFGN